MNDFYIITSAEGAELFQSAIDGYENYQLLERRLNKIKELTSDVNRNKELHDLVERLKRIFPHLILYYEGEAFSDEEYDGFAPPRNCDWYEFLAMLEENGLTITNKK